MCDASNLKAGNGCYPEHGEPNTYSLRGILCCAVLILRVRQLPLVKPISTLQLQDAL